VLSLDQFLLILPMMALGAYVQAVTGFAMGLVVVGAVTVLDAASVSLVAAAVSVMTLVNAGIGLHGRTHLVDRRSAIVMLSAMMPCVVVGVLLLDHMTETWATALNATLGAFILAGAVLLTLKPEPRTAPSGPGGTILVGGIGGIFTGLFATGGPPVVYHLYREPWPVATVRTTLLAVFLVSAAARVGFLGARGTLTPEILTLSTLSVPMVAAATALGRRFPPPLSDRQMRRVAFMLLMVIGVSLLAL
jgi:uncharacterized membrane protein YfcA